MEISLCMIVKNEENIMGRCLDSVKDIVDEIIIVDTGSDDNTVAIAKEYQAKIYHFDWCNDFSKARNFAFSKATKDYLFWLDADDYITKENQEKLKKLKKEFNEEYNIVSMIYSLGRDEKGNTITSLRRNRIVKKNKQLKWIGRIHEYLDCAGNYYHSDIEVFHDKHKTYTDRNLSIYKQMIKEGDTFSPRDSYYYANELYYNGFYDEAIDQYKKYIDMNAGWIEDRKSAVLKLISCFNILNRTEENLDFLLKSLQWGKPNAEVCCRIAECFIDSGQTADAIYWYQIALRTVPEKDNMAITINDYYTFIPAIQLCVLFCELGDFESANAYNELAGVFQPNSNKVEHNRNYLKDKIK